MILVELFQGDYITRYVNERIKYALESFVDWAVDSYLLDILDKDNCLTHDERIAKWGWLAIFTKAEMYWREECGVNNHTPSNVETNEKAISDWLREPLNEILESLESNNVDRLSIESQFFLEKVLDDVCETWGEFDDEEYLKRWKKGGVQPYELVVKQEPPNELIKECLDLAIEDYNICLEDDEINRDVRKHSKDKLRCIEKQTRLFVDIFTDLRNYKNNDIDPVIELEGTWYWK